MTEVVMDVNVPDDVLHLVCQQLFEARDFSTLYRCALASKRLATPAIMELYRMYEIAPITNRGRDENLQVTPAKLTPKWTKLWRSIIMSCTNQTLLPYVSYLRVLDLKDLGYLFDDGQFVGKLMKEFFNDVFVEGPPKGVKRGWDMRGTMQSIGELITQKSPLVEELDGNLDGPTVMRWVPRLKKLTSLRLWNGSALADCGTMLAEYCPGFRAIEFYHWMDAMADTSSNNPDAEFASFLSELKLQSLTHLQVIRRASFGPLTFSVLSERHGNVLTELSLNDLPTSAIQELSELKGCTALHTLTLSDERRTTDLQQLEGVFDEVIEWLRNCKQLKSIHLDKFLSGAAILTPLFREQSLQLEELELNGYSQSSAIAFYDSLHTQAETLVDLQLQSDVEEVRERIDSLVMSICKLRRLKSLVLKMISDSFVDTDITVIASSLRQLEGLWLSGYSATDEILGALAGLHSLKRLDMFAISSFSCGGLLTFISELGPGNKGLYLGVSMALPARALSEEEQEIVRHAIREKIDGRFDYTLTRDYEAEDDFSESDSD